MSDEAALVTIDAQAPAVEQSAPVVENTSAVESAPVVEAPAPAEVPVVETPAAPAEAESFLAEPKEPVVETKTEADTKEVKTEAPAGEPLTEVVPFETFTIAEGVEVSPEFMADASKALHEMEAAKGDRAKTQAAAQRIVDITVAKIKEGMQFMRDSMEQERSQQKTKWREELLKDPVLGQNDAAKLKESALSMANFLARNGGSKQEVTDFRKFAAETGADNNPALIRVLNNLKAKIDKYENESSKMLPGTKPSLQKSVTPGKNMIATLYGSK